MRESGVAHNMPATEADRLLMIDGWGERVSRFTTCRALHSANVTVSFVAFIERSEGNPVELILLVPVLRRAFRPVGASTDLFPARNGAIQLTAYTVFRTILLSAMTGYKLSAAPLAFMRVLAPVPYNIGLYAHLPADYPWKATLRTVSFFRPLPLYSL